MQDEVEGDETRDNLSFFIFILIISTKRSYQEEICYYDELEQPVSYQMLDQSQSNY